MLQTKIETGYIPRRHQQEIHDHLKRFSVLVCHRRFGKTLLSVNALIDAALRCKQVSPRYGYVAPQYNQAKSIAWDYLKRYTQNIPGVKRNESELWVELPNTARIRLYGADNPDALRGMYWDGVVLDEVAQMRPEVWGEIIRPALTDRHGWALFIGTPKGMNIFSELYFRAVKEPEWYAGCYTAEQTKIIPDAELDEARRSMSDAQYRQEFECDFGASVEDALIPIDLVNEATERKYQASAYKHAPKIMGVDVARFGDDRSVIIIRQGVQAYALKKLKDTDLMTFANIVADTARFNHVDIVFVDEIGIGAGVVDALKMMRVNVYGVNSGKQATYAEKYLNKRAEMWCNLRDWLKEGGSIPDDLELKNDLISPKYSYDLKSRVVLEKKEDMKSKRGLPSPDCADALALTFAYQVSNIDDDEDGYDERKYGRSRVGGY